MEETKAPELDAPVKAGDRFHYKEITLAVMEAYIAAKQLPDICAQQIDPAPITESRRKTATSIEYTVDIERATERVLGGDPTLERAWFRIACKESVEPHIASQVYLRCGRMYEARKLQPWLYHQRNRYPHRRAA